MTRADLERALRQQQDENAALRAELALVQAPAGLSLAAGTSFSDHEQLMLLMQELYTAVLLADGDGRVTWISRGFTALCGFELPEVLGRRPGDFLRPGMDNPPLQEYIGASLRAKIPFQYEVRNPRPGPDSGWIRVKVQPVYNEQREVTGMAGMLEDISEWKKSQSSLAQNEHRFRTLAENVPGVLYEWRGNFDGTYRFDYVSPKIYELFGLEKGDTGHVLDFFHPDDAPAMQQSIQRAISTKSPWFFEGRVLLPGQPMRWLRGSSAVTGSDAEGVDFSGILLDITPLKEAETALRENDLRWRMAVEGFGDGAWELNVQTRDIYYSPEYKAMLGYRDEEFPNVYDTWQAHTHPEDLAEVRRVVAVLLQSDAPLGAVEYRIRCKDGTYKWVLSRALISARDATGAPLVLTGLQTDITELKKAREELGILTRRLSTVVANFQEGLVVEDENRRIVFTNEAFCKLLQAPIAPARFVGKAGAWLTEGSKAHIRQPGPYLARIAELLRRQEPVAGDVLSLQDGRTLRRDYVPIYDQKRYIGHLWKYEDITERTKVETDLRQREEKYRGIIENMSLGLVEADLNDHLLYANQSFCDMTGYCTAELTSHRLSPLLLKDEALALVESKRAVRQQGIADSYEIVVTTKSGDGKWLLVSGAPLYDDAQQLIGSIGIYLDVTPQKQLEARLREAKALAEVSTRAKQDFLANMSHEIRTPMNAILGMSQLLAKTSLDGPQGSYLHAITASAENLLVIINDILDLSKIEAGRMAVETIDFSPDRVCSQVEKTLLYKAEEKGLSFVTHIGPGVPATLLGDPYRITQVLLNLAGNAVKFTEKGAVTVVCRLAEVGIVAGVATVEFSVQDTGIGIEAGYLSQIFDDFSQEDSSFTRQFGGTGLGLGISKKLVELLGGELHIESQKNRGTTSRFTLRLPVASTAELAIEREDDLSGLRHVLRGKRVLLVEDNFFNRMLATIFLTNAELEVTEAANGQVAVGLARQHSFDLVLMDVQMPIMNGYEATAELRQIGLTVPIIALTANAIDGERDKCLEAGMNDYLTKPFREPDLISMVHSWVLDNRTAS